MKSIVAVTLLLGACAVSASAQLPHFEHIILVIQENRTADNLFGGMIGTQYFVNGMDLQKAANAQP
jgi:phospholipase C